MNDAPPADLPAEIDLGRHRDFKGRSVGQWARHCFLLLLFVFIVAGLLNAFGQADATDTAGGVAGSLSVRAPSRVRGGLHYQAEFQIHAKQALGAPTLVLQRGWIDQTTLNTLEPEPAGTTTDADGNLKVRFPSMAPGRTLVVYAQFEANPIDVGSKDAGVALYDGSTPIASISRTQFDFP